MNPYLYDASRSSGRTEILIIDEADRRICIGFAHEYRALGIMDPVRRRARAREVDLLMRGSATPGTPR